MSKKDYGLMVLGLVAGGAFALFALSARSKPATAPTPAPVPAGPVQAHGGVRNVVVGQTPIEKSFGATIACAVDYQLLLTSASTGAPVTKQWPVRFEGRLGHSTTLGWKTSGELGFSESGLRNFTATATSDNIHRAEAFNFITPADPNQIWDVHVSMFIAHPDSFGNPTSTWDRLGSEFKKDGAVKSINAGIAASGGIFNVVVGQIGVGREDILRYLVSSVPRGSNIRNDYPGQSAGFNQSGEFIPAFRTRFNPGMGQVGRGQAGRPFRQNVELIDLLKG